MKQFYSTKDFQVTYPNSALQVDINSVISKDFNYYRPFLIDDSKEEAPLKEEPSMYGNISFNPISLKNITGTVTGSIPVTVTLKATCSGSVDYTKTNEDGSTTSGGVYPSVSMESNRIKMACWAKTGAYAQEYIATIIRDYYNKTTTKSTNLQARGNYKVSMGGFSIPNVNLSEWEPTGPCIRVEKRNTNAVKKFQTIYTWNEESVDPESGQTTITTYSRKVIFKVNLENCYVYLDKDKLEQQASAAAAQSLTTKNVSPRVIITPPEMDVPHTGSSDSNMQIDGEVKMGIEATEIIVNNGASSSDNGKIPIFSNPQTDASINLSNVSINGDESFTFTPYEGPNMYADGAILQAPSGSFVVTVDA